MSKKIEYNENISANTFRLIDLDGTDMGILSKTNALTIAEEKDAGLVLVSLNPPVVKICDVGKYIYQQEKKEKLQRKNTKQTQIKKINVRLCTQMNDLQTKTKMAKKFLADGDRVQFIMFFRKRERQNMENGRTIMKQIEELLHGTGKLDGDPTIDGSTMSCSFSPVLNKKNASTS